MFSGIIERLAPVEVVEPIGSSVRIAIDTGYGDLERGESVAINGVCLTVVEHDGQGRAAFFLSPETLSCSTLQFLKVGTLVNLERAVRLETRLSGHMVQGHVDGVAEILSVAEEAGAHRLELGLGRALARYCVPKGPVALDGISLTINSLADDGARVRLGVMIIPHTWSATNLHSLAVGDRVNVEVDIISKYVERLCQPYNQP